jgi:high frequency lysogenization protein
MSIESSTLALAGIYQSAELVRQIAQHGSIGYQDTSAFEASINSILKIDANSTAEVYGGLRGVKMGLKTLVTHLHRETSTGQEQALMRYILSIMILERKFVKRKELMREIRLGVEHAIALTQVYEPTHPHIVIHLGELYGETLEKVRYPIPILGEAHHIEKGNNLHKILALILAGLRSAVLWRQKGGNRWQFIWSRHRILQTAQHFLDIIKKTYQ